MSKKKAIKSLSFLWMGSLLGSGSTFIIYMILARELGPENFGIFSSAFSMITIFSLLAGFGISQVWLKLFGIEGWSAIRWVTPTLSFTLTSLIIVTFSLSLWAFLGPHNNITKQILLLMLFHIYGYIAVELVSSKLQLEERYTFLALWQLLPNLSRLLLIIFLLYVINISFSTTDIGIIYALIGITFTTIGIYHLKMMTKGQFALKGHKEQKQGSLQHPKIKEVYSEAWPFGLASLFAFVYLQSDIIMVKYISGDTEAGYYNVSFVILTAILVFPSVLYSKFLMPKYHRWAKHDTDKFHYAYKKGNLVMLLSGSTIMLIIYLFSNTLVPLLFGNQYLASIPLVNIIALSLPVYFVAYSVGATLVTNQHMKLKVKLMGSVAVVNILLNLLLIPNYGAEGAAISTVISNILLLALYYISAEKKVFTKKKEYHVADN